MIRKFEEKDTDNEPEAGSGDRKELQLVRTLVSTEQAQKSEV